MASAHDGDIIERDQLIERDDRNSGFHGLSDNDPVKGVAVVIRESDGSVENVIRDGDRGHCFKRFCLWLLVNPFPIVGLPSSVGCCLVLAYLHRNSVLLDGV